VCAVGRGDFASVDRGHSDEHSTIDTNDAPACPDDCRYDIAQSRPCIPDQPPACLQAVCGLALGRSPETATPDDVKHFQQHLIESGTSICMRNQTMTGLKFLFRVTLRRHDLVAEIFHLKEPVKGHRQIAGYSPSRYVFL